MREPTGAWLRCQNRLQQMGRYAAPSAVIVGMGLWALLAGGLRSANPAKVEEATKPASTSNQAPVPGLPNKETWAGSNIEQPQAMIPFFDKLSALHRGKPENPVHILHFGDSHTAADDWTGDLRYAFQRRFGNGGPGFSLAGHPFNGYRRSDTRHGATGDGKPTAC